LFQSILPSHLSQDTLDLIETDSEIAITTREITCTYNASISSGTPTPGQTIPTIDGYSPVLVAQSANNTAQWAYPNFTATYSVGWRMLSGGAVNPNGAKATVLYIKNPS
jgi:hypothetical protein